MSTADEYKAQQAAERHKEALNALGIDPSPEEESGEEAEDNTENQGTDTPEEESKPEGDPADEGEEPEEDADEPEGKEEEDGEGEDVENPNPAKKTVPLTRLLEAKKEIKELRAKLENKEKETTPPVEETKNGEDLSDLVEATLKEITDGETYEEKDIAFLKKMVGATLKAHSKLSTKEKAALSPEIQEKLNLLDEFQKEQKEKSAALEQKVMDDNEWNEALPELQKKYPNATPKLWAEAKKKLLEIAHSEKGGKLIEIGGEKKIISLPFDFLVSKNQKLFDTILGVKPSGKTFESGRETGGEVEEDIDFTSPDMSPAKLAIHQQRVAARRAKENNGKIRFS